MAKTIAFLISSTSEAGVQPPKPLAAYHTEEDRDVAWGERKNPNDTRFVRDEIIVDLQKIAEDAIAKLTPVERLALGFPQKEHFKCSNATVTRQAAYILPRTEQ